MPRPSYDDSPLARWHERQREEREARGEPIPYRRSAAEEAAHQRARKERRAALVRHHAAKRRSVRLQRMPVWADEEAIKAVYAKARELTRATGIAHHVDHEIPLLGELVSGLHVHNNLQILTGSENSRKGNRWSPQ